MSTPYWRFIHYFALHNKRDLILQVKHFFEDLSGVWYDPESAEDLIEWSRILHNKMNTLSGKYDKWDSRDFTIAHKPTCDLCVNNLVYRFPWGFIHSIAEQANSMNFLKEFNATYPCDICRGGFFDEPQAGESTLDWTYRNHTRLDPSYVPPSLLPVDLLIPFGFYKDPFTNAFLPILPKSSST
jgi:hypothetical protein